jgi:hypothetical protein
MNDSDGAKEGTSAEMGKPLWLSSGIAISNFRLHTFDSLTLVSL